MFRYSSPYSKFSHLRISEVVEKKVIEDFRGVIGNRVRYVGTGGGATSPEVLSFLNKLFPNCFVGDGYGTTETGGSFSCSFLF